MPSVSSPRAIRLRKTPAACVEGPEITAPTNRPSENTRRLYSFLRLSRNNTASSPSSGRIFPKVIKDLSPNETEFRPTSPDMTLCARPYCILQLFPARQRWTKARLPNASRGLCHGLQQCRLPRRHSGHSSPSCRLQEYRTLPRSRSLYARQIGAYTFPDDNHVTVYNLAC